jgi:PKD repeat protein
MRLIAFTNFLFITYLLQAQAPTANFSATPTQICIGAAVNFTDLSTAGGSPITSRAWDFGDGNSSTLTNPSHTYTTPGTYTITLVVTASNGQADPEVKLNYITVNPLPTVGFTTSGNGCTVPFAVTFTNTSQTGAGITYNWSFGNGQTSTSQNPAAVTYNTAGTFPVTLVVTDGNTGCTNSIIQNIVVSNYSATFNAPAQGCVGSAVSFTDMSTVGANSWSWDFGDGQTSTSQNPSNIYGAPGTYNVTLTSQNTVSGCSSTFNQSITINPLPIPTFSANTLTGCAPLNVTFTNSSGAGTFVWDFGNGITFNGANPPVQTYTTNSSFSVSLTMTNAAGCSNTTTINNYINVSAPTVQFSMDVYNGCEPLTVQFSESSTSPNPIGDPIVSWLWDFGDGSPITNAQSPPPHVYNEGVYSVTLTVTTQNGCQATVTLADTIQVGSISSVNFSVAPVIECAKTPIDFTDLTTFNGTPDPADVTYSWDFGDGGLSSLQNPSYPYPSDTGYFDVTLIVDWRGCKDTMIMTQAVYIKAPISLFTLDQTLFCNPGSLPITLNVADNAIIGQLSDDVEMIWKWGDGTPNNILSNAMLDGAGNGDISHNYSAYGTYTVEQVVYNYTTGCSDSTTQTIYVSQTIAGFTLSNDSTCIGSPIQLTSTSTSSHPFGTFSYDMGNGGSTSGSPASYTYNTAGAFNIVLTATNSVGCASTATFNGLDALSLPIASITPSDITGCAPITVTYSNSSSITGNGMPLSSFLWTFTDATTQTTNSIGTNTQFTFNTEGTFNTTLVATDQFGCVSPAASSAILITKPVANFTLDDVVCNLEGFTAVNSSTGAVSYQWFVDGTVVSTNTNYSNSFNEPSTPIVSSVSHNVMLIATDVNGCKDTLVDPIVVSTPNADVTYTLTGANVNAAGEFTCPPVFAGFTDNSDSYGNISIWSWDFGDGKTSTLENPNNTYVFAGTYTLNYSIVDEYGCSSDTVLVDYLTIFGPSADPIWTGFGDVCGQTFIFEAQNQVNVSSIVWNLDDGTIIDNTNQFNHTYLDYDSFFPTALISDTLGCEVLYELPQIDVISNGLNAFFTPSPSEGPMGTTFTFFESSTFTSASISTWTWVINGDTLVNFSGADVSQQYGLPGDYTITLFITDQNGCVDSYTTIVTITNEFNIPNVITTNGDGVNDLFILPADIFKSFDILILNRWGNVIHQRSGATGVLLWDGLDQKSGEKVNDGVYFYKLEGILVSDDFVSKHGNVTVVNGQ